MDKITDIRKEMDTLLELIEDVHQDKRKWRQKCINAERELEEESFKMDICRKLRE